MRLTLLVRAYCHLCDEMRDALGPLLAGRDVTLDERDVDADAALEARYGDLVPVLLAGSPEDGREICHWRLDASALRATLSA